MEGNGATLALDVSDTPSDSSLLQDSSTADARSGAVRMGRELPEDLVAQIEDISDASGMDVNVAVIDFDSAARGGYRSNSRMVSASMIKLIIAEAFLQQVANGTCSLDEYYTLQDSDIVGGTGSLGGYGVGAQVTYRQMLDMMISESDNTATNILIDALETDDETGMEVVNAEAARLGLMNTQLNRYMMDSDAISEGIENYVSADDVAALLEMVYDGAFVDAESSAIMLEALEQQQDPGGILDGLPDDTVFAHKTGELDDVCHDGGIVECEHSFVLVVLCGGDGYNRQGALDAMALVAEAVYDYGSRAYSA